MKMCGILARLGTKKNLAPHVNRLQARGPEQTRIEEISDTVSMGFTRLAINGLSEDGMQPFTKGPLTWICNGEIYNYKSIEADLGWTTPGASDCDCLGELYLKYRDSPVTFLRALDGVFALVMYDDERKQLFVARDPYGVRPLFIASKPNVQTMSYSSHMFVSEIKAASPYFDIITPFYPGYYSVYDTITLALLNTFQYHTIPWITQPQFEPSAHDSHGAATVALRYALEEAVRKRIPSDVEPACLLSGGLDSSLIAALVQQNLKQLKRPSLQTFSIGFKGSSDLYHAKLVAEWIGSRHTEIVMTPSDFFKRIPDVIRAIETCDTTTVRASVGNFLVAEEIKKTSTCKVVFNGDGSDELFGGYLYFNNAPDDNAFHTETGRLLQDIHFFDLLRSDRCISANGLEPRTPFLDKQFVALVRSIHPSLLRPIQGEKVEKALLRDAFDDE
jgi:asparagine synthase (glutamine-hydrolysing)